MILRFLDEIDSGTSPDREWERLRDGFAENDLVSLSRSVGADDKHDTSARNSDWLCTTAVIAGIKFDFGNGVDSFPSAFSLQRQKCGHDKTIKL